MERTREEERLNLRYLDVGVGGGKTETIRRAEKSEERFRGRQAFSQRQENVVSQL